VEGPCGAKLCNTESGGSGGGSLSELIHSASAVPSPRIRKSKLPNREDIRGNSKGWNISRGGNVGCRRAPSSSSASGESL
jgi:hypothetical protein